MLFYDNHKVYMNGNYPAIWLDGRSQHVHRLEWMKYFGQIPKGCVIHHKDENKMNWSIDNLEMLSRSGHVKEHKDIVHRPGIHVLAKKGSIIKEFDSIEHAAEECKTHPACIQRCFKGVQRQSNGWTFERR